MYSRFSISGDTMCFSACAQVLYGVVMFACLALTLGAMFTSSAFFVMKIKVERAVDMRSLLSYIKVDALHLISGTVPPSPPSSLAQPPQGFY